MGWETVRMRNEQRNEEEMEDKCDITEEETKREGDDWLERKEK